MTILAFGMIVAASIFANLFIQEVLEDNYIETVKREYHKVEDASKEIERLKGNINNEIYFKKLINLHFQSVIASNFFWDQKEQCKNKIESLKELEENISEEINEINRKIDSISYFDRELRDKKRTLIEMYKKTKNQIYKYCEIKNQYYDYLTQNNINTSELKYLIKNTCGEKGIDWYYRNYIAKGRK